jgi:IS30 family transposase
MTKSQVSEAKKTGRPRLEIDWEQLDKLCAIQCTKAEIADILGVSEDTIDRRCKEEHECSFAVYYKKHQSHGKASLRRQQFKTAMKGNPTLLVWLGKQMLGQTDQPHEGDTDLEKYFVDSRKGKDESK